MSDQPPTRPKATFNAQALLVGLLVMIALRGAVQVYIEVSIRAFQGQGAQVEMQTGEQAQIDAAQHRADELRAAQPVDEQAVAAAERELQDTRDRVLSAQTQRAGEAAGGFLKAGLGVVLSYLVFAPFCYFLGGLLVAWRSHGRTLMEPALAAVFTVCAVTGYEVLRGDALNVPCLGCSGALSFVLALIGALIGEKVQAPEG